VVAVTSSKSDERASGEPVGYQRLSDAVRGLGLEPAATIDEMAALIESYAAPSTLSAAYRVLMLEWYGVRDVARRGRGFLAKEDLANILVRMAVLDASTSFAVEETARALDEAPETLSQLLATKHLYGYDSGHGMMLPGWQFVLDDGNMPVRVISSNLHRVVEAIPVGTPPALVRGIMTLEDPSLPARTGEPVSPREWLLLGGSPFPVAATLARHLEGSRLGALDMSFLTS